MGTEERQLLFADFRSTTATIKFLIISRGEFEKEEVMFKLRPIEWIKTFVTGNLVLVNIVIPIR